MINEELAACITHNRLLIHVKPHARETRIVRVLPGEAWLEVAAMPRKNQANVEVLRFLKKLTNRPCRIRSGLASRDKLIEFG